MLAPYGLIRRRRHPTTDNRQRHIKVEWPSDNTDVKSKSDSNDYKIRVIEIDPHPSLKNRPDGHFRSMGLEWANFD